MMDMSTTGPGQAHAMPARVLFLNGPPFSGKDLAARLLARSYDSSIDPNWRGPALVTSFAAPIRRAISSFLNLGMTPNAMEIMEAKHGKDTPNSVFYNAIPRRLYITLSESWAKQHFGPDIFGRLARDFLISKSRKHSLFIMKDSGFASEAEVVISYFGAHACKVLRIHREGCDFNNDSRSYWDPPAGQDVEVINIYNPRPLQSQQKLGGDELEETQETYRLRLVEAAFGKRHKEDGHISGSSD